MNRQKTSFMFKRENFSEKEAAISSPIFTSGGCEWSVMVHPKGDYIDHHLNMYLLVVNTQSLQRGWKRKASYSFILMNQSGKELLRVPEREFCFCAEALSWGYGIKSSGLSQLKEKGLLENNKLIIKLEVEVVEVVHKGEVTGKEMLDFNGFQIHYSHVMLACPLLFDHPGIAEDFKPKNKLVKAAYMKRKKHIFSKK